MKRGISLYIGDSLVDVSQDSLILFNFTQEMLENPTIVKNSYTQQITLQGTPRNNKVFSEAFRLDRTNLHGFNTRIKTPFTIYNDTNEILESGYIKLDAVTRNKGVAEYKVSLYGGLGSFLYSLSYNSAGEKKSLADLDYLGTQNPETEFNYTINRTFVRNSWDVLAGGLQNQLGEVLNFAPAYNGIPEGFSADKAIFDFTNSPYTYNGVHQVNLSRSYTDREAHDLRSYLQRPVLRVQAILQAIQRFATSIGWTFYIDQDLALSDYITRTWLTLPILNLPNPANNMRSGVAFTKRDLLKGTDTPAEYLLSLCKTFGLKLVCDDRTKTIDLMHRTAFFQDEVIDLSSRIDLSKPLSIDPLVIKSKWYQMESETKGEYADVYSSTYGRVYGSQRINTGYEFNADTKVITEKILFKGGVQAQETSSAYLDAVDDNLNVIPAPFLDGGEYITYNPVTGEAISHDLLPSRYYYTWWNTANKGADLGDLVQLHDKDNKSMEGINVLLFFDKMVQCPGSQFVISDDVPDQMGESPCWNYSGINSVSAEEIPHFSRFLVNAGAIEQSLDFGEALELYVPGLEYDDGSSIYKRCWRNYLLDRYDENTKMVTLKVNFQGIQVGSDLLRKFYWFDGCLWTLNKIKNYSLTTFDPVECEFIQVQDKSRYFNGQI